MNSTNALNFETDLQVKNIKAIFFDIGGTLVEKGKFTHQDLSPIIEMANLVGYKSSPQDLIKGIKKGENEYKEWRSKSLIELSPEERWPRFLLQDFPDGFIQMHAKRLQTLWSASKGKKWIDPLTIKTLQELSDRGYILGTISHTSPVYLRDAGIGHLFKVMIHAAEFGRRKPHPSLFLTAARESGVTPADCAYVGDRPSRDVLGSKEAGMGQTIILKHNEVEESETAPIPMEADLYINSISDLLSFFPSISASINGTESKQEQIFMYDAALSTMWGMNPEAPLKDFFTFGRKLGFSRFELNHQLSQEVFDSIDFNQYRIGTIHDPCPAVIPAKQLEKTDLVITSLDENSRSKGVDVVKNTIEHACLLRANSVVIHPGRIVGDHSMDDALRDLYRGGEKGTPKYELLLSKVMADRKERAIPHFDALMKSLSEIIDFAKDTGVSLGFENRFHYYELPVSDELQIILEEFKQPWVGWQLDVGHLQVFDALGYEDFENCLIKFGQRIIGVHLHDVMGIKDHQPPGTGDVDFKLLANYLPEFAYRTLEVDKSLSQLEIQKGMQTLFEAGCVIRI
jgi:HAD superfamily hydrolase (TIGR01509 family)